MNSLPPGWKIATLDELQANEPRAITDGPFGSNLTSAHYTSNGARVVRLQNIGDGTFNDARAFVSIRHFERLRNHEVNAGDLLIASLGEELPRACIAPASIGPAIVKADCIRVRLGEHVDPRWVMYAMQTPVVRRWAKNHLHGVGRPRLGLKVIRQIPVVLPPLCEQRHIVEILEGHLSRLDAATDYVKAAWLRIDGIAVSMLKRHALLADAKTRSLGELLERPLSNGRSVPSMANGFPVLRLTALTAAGIDPSQKKGGAWTAEEARQFIVERGDFLVSRGNGTLRLVGRGGLVRQQPDPVAYPDTLIRVRVDERIVYPEYLALVWNSPTVRMQLESMARTTAGIYKVNQNHLRSARFPVPTLDAQRRISDDLLAVRASMANLRTVLQHCESRSLLLRRSVMDAAFTGRLTGQTTDHEIIEEMAGV